MFSEHLRIGNYHYDPRPGLIEKKAGRQVFILGFACAYNALGLIGSECNGIFVLNKTKRDVVLDEHMKIDSGFHGPRPQHIAELRRVCALPPKDFLGWIKAHPRAREQYR
jgi:hypothetical protein